MPLQTPLPLPTSVLIDGDHQLSAIFKGRVDVDQLLALPLEATKDTGEALRQTAMFPGRAIDHEVLVATRKSAEAENRFKLATTLKNSNQPAQAAKEFQRVIQLHGESSLAHNELGVALVALGQVEKAAEHYRRALEIDPNFATAYYNLGNRYWDRGDDEEAKRLYEKAIEIKPNYVDALRNLGLMLSDEGEFSEAQALYEKIIEIDPHDARAHNTLGQLLGAQRIEFQRALELHQHAVLLDPDFGDAHRNLGILLAASGNVQQAAVHFERAVELNPGDELAKKNLVKAQSILREGKLSP